MRTMHCQYVIVMKVCVQCVQGNESAEVVMDASKVPVREFVRGSMNSTVSVHCSSARSGETWRFVRLKNSARHSCVYVYFSPSEAFIETWQFVWVNSWLLCGNHFVSMRFLGQLCLVAPRNVWRIRLVRQDLQL